METPRDYLTPDQVTDVDFRSRRRGLDPAAVDEHLQAVADSLRDILSDNEALRDEVSALRTELDRIPDRAKRASEPMSSLDEEEVRSRLGAEASRIVGEARREADAILAEADQKARHILAEAETVFAERSAVADAEVHALRSAELERHRDELAHTEAEAARMIEEARVVRSQILQDLARRRTLARRQIDQLRAGRERLISSYDTIRTVLDDLGAELHVSMAEARSAAQAAGHGVLETSVEELEAEIEAARLTGLLDTGPVAIVDDLSDAADRSEVSVEESRGDDYVQTDPTVTELFERMRADRGEGRQEGDDADSAPAPERTPNNQGSRSKDSARQR